mmetsp:Transcript_29374/g.67615  ORF Transcript_29374/g.67615 Transcript_29374/m.67615 type:complete len:200 (+) Transcript_29374:373-972(+)
MLEKLRRRQRHLPSERRCVQKVWTSSLEAPLCPQMNHLATRLPHPPLPKRLESLLHYLLPHLPLPLLPRHRHPLHDCLAFPPPLRLHPPLRFPLPQHSRHRKQDAPPAPPRLVPLRHQHRLTPPHWSRPCYQRPHPCRPGQLPGPGLCLQAPLSYPRQARQLQHLLQPQHLLRLQSLLRWLRPAHGQRRPVLALVQLQQ